MQRFSLLMVCGWLMLAATPVLAGPWESQKKSDGIEIYTREVPGSEFRQVRGVMQIQSTLAGLVALIQDADACPDWADQCKHSYVFEAVSDTESYVYTLNDLPWPVKNRDVLAHVTWYQHPDTLAVTMESTATSGKMPVKKGLIRLQQAQASWIFTPLTDGLVEVVTRAHLNPGSALPAWVTNMLLVGSPHKTMSGLRAAVQQPRYQQATVSFVKEPG